MSTITGELDTVHKQLYLIRRWGTIDSRAHHPPNSDPNPYLAHAYPDATPELYDIPIGIVNRALYGPRRSNDAPEVAQPESI
jgi:hypothetical protein